MANTEYLITKLSFANDQKIIKDIFVYEYDGITLSDGQDRQRHWLVNRLTEGAKVYTMTKNEKGEWIRGDSFTLTNGVIKWGEKNLPENITKRKTFVSYYHKDDQDYRNKFENLFDDLVVSKSVEDGDIDSDNSDEYIKQLIQKDYLKDTTVFVVLIGPKTKCRKHVDWEISGALSSKIGGNSGLIGILLPSHPDYGADKKLNYENLPKRLAANIKNGYGIVYDWTNDRVTMQKRIETAFTGKSDSEKIVNRSVPQMDKDTCS